MGGSNPALYKSGLSASFGWVIVCVRIALKAICKGYLSETVHA